MTDLIGAALGALSGGSEPDVETGETPTFTGTVRKLIEQRLGDLHTAMPGEVVSFDADAQEADVQPLTKRRYPSGEVVDLPMLQRVPVVFPRGGPAFITWPLAAGDKVALLFCERSIDAWKDDGGIYNPEDGRKHHLSDAVAIPGLFPSSDTVEVSSDELLISCGDAELRLAEGGTATFTNGTITLELAASGAVSLENDNVTIAAAADGEVSVENGTGNFIFKANADIEFDTGTVQGLFGNGGKVIFENATGELIDTLSSLCADLKQLLTDIQNATTSTMLGPMPLVMPTFVADLATLDADKTKLDSFKA